jgi:hypothetical protein
MTTIVDEINSAFDDNLTRVRNLVSQYTAISGTGRGRRAVLGTGGTHTRFMP